MRGGGRLKRKPPDSELISKITYCAITNHPIIGCSVRIWVNFAIPSRDSILWDVTLVIGAAGLMLEQVSGKGLWQYAITISYIFKSGAFDLERSPATNGGFVFLHLV